MDDLLSHEIHDLRFWGVKGVDYEVGDDGLYYRTEEQRKNVSEQKYKEQHLCDYSQFPQYLGTSRDGKNAMMPSEQPSEFLKTLPESVKKVFDAYGVTTYPRLMHSAQKAGVWFPIYSFAGGFTTDTPGGVAWTKMAELKHAELPKVVMAKDFEKGWSDYLEAYSAVKPEDAMKELQEEVDRRIERAKKYGE